MALTGVVIDAGHGGSDGGAVGNGIVEKDLNLLISKYMYDRLRELGIPAKMTRTTDETLDSNTRTKRILDAFGNGKDVLVISNHINAGGGDGAEVIYALRNNSTFSNKILEEIQKELNYEYQKYLFIALCLCKFINSEKYKDILFVKNNTETSRQRIYTLSNCKETRDKKPYIGYCLKNDGFIEVLGLDMWKLNYYRDCGEEALRFIPYDNMIYEYRKYVGEKVTRCERCGEWIYKKSNRTKYCKKCANLVYNEQRREAYKSE